MNTSSFQLGNLISEQIVDNLSTFGEQIDSHQFKLNIHPIISNAIYARDKELLEQERFNTLIKLARVLDDTNLDIAIKALNYKLIIE